MASLAVAAAGAAVGAAAGAAVGGTVLGVSAILFGAQLGFVIGSLVGNLFFGPEVPDQKGPRINDVNVSTSTYGRVIPIPYGSCTVGGNMIWLGQIIERKNSREVGGKGFGGGGATQTTFEYFGNFAAAFCEGPIQSIRRIWADNRLVVDLTENNNGQSYAYDAGNYTIYLGTEDQQPDSLIEADLGVGNVPAYRGTAYVVFNELPLKDFGNRIPNIEAEVVAAANPAWDQTYGIGDLTSQNINAGTIYMDPQQPILWHCDGFPALESVNFQKIERFGNNLIQSKNIADIGPDKSDYILNGFGVFIEDTGSDFVVRRDGNLNNFDFSDGWSGRTSAPIVDPFYDLIYIWACPNTLFERPFVLELDKDFNFTGYAWGGLDQRFPDDAFGHVVYNVDALKRFIVVGFQDPATTTASGDSGGACYILDAGLGLDGPTYNVERPVSAFLSGPEPVNDYGMNLGLAMVTPPMGDLAPGGPSDRIVYNIAYDPDGKKIWVLTARTDTAATGATIAEFNTETEEWSFVALEGNTGGNTGFKKVLNIFDAVDNSSGGGAGITYDTNTGHLILIGENDLSSTDYFRINPENYTVEASADRYTDNRPKGAWGRSENISNPQVPGSFWITDFDSVENANVTALIETTNFQVLEKRVHDNSFAGGGATAVGGSNTPIVDRRTTSLWFFESGVTGEPDGLVRAKFFDDDAGTSVADIIRDLATRIGQTSADIDVSELTGDTVAGYVIASESTARGAVEPLKLVAAMDAVESDWIIKFLKIDRSSVATVAWDDLGAEVGNKSADVRLREPRTQEKDLPIEVSITAMLQTREYLPSTQTARRWQDQGAGDSEGKNDIQIPVIFQSDADIKKIADRILFAQWSRRQNQEFRTGPKFLDIDPMDVVTIEKRGSGVVADIPSQVTEMEIAPGGAISFTGRVSEPFLFTEAAVEESIPVPTEELSGVGIPVDSPTLGYFWDAPPITSINTNGSPVWGAAPLLGQSNYQWSGASLKRSSDGSVGSYQDVASTDVELPAFKLREVFPAADPVEDNWNAFNGGLSVQVEMVAGNIDPTSASRIDVLNGANIAVIGSEVIQYIDVTNDGDGLFTLSNILRGRFGTETEMVERRIGTKGFLVSDAPGAFVPFASEVSRGQTNFYKSVTFGLFEDNAAAETFVHTARGLKPLSPTGLAATVDGSGNKTITWIRRTRFNGEWANGTGRVPLNEVSKEYEVDLHKAGSIVRSFTEIETESLLYEKADYDADFPASETFGADDGDLFLNLDFEEGDLSLWIDPSDDFEIRSSDGAISAIQGSFFALNDNGSSTSLSSLSREIDVTELSIAGNGAASFDVQVGTTSNFLSPPYQLRIECLDRNGNVLRAAETAATNASGGTWIDVSSPTVNVPEDTTKLRIVLSSERNVGFDDVRISVTRSSTGKVAAEVYQISDAVGRGQPRKRVV
jgi:hypothetical protein